MKLKKHLSIFDIRYKQALVVDNIVKLQSKMSILIDDQDLYAITGALSSMLTSFFVIEDITDKLTFLEFMSNCWDSAVKASNDEDKGDFIN